VIETSDLGAKKPRFYGFSSDFGGIFVNSDTKENRIRYCNKNINLKNLTINGQFQLRPPELPVVEQSL